MKEGHEGCVRGHHEDNSMLTRTIKSNNDFTQTVFCLMTPGSMALVRCPGHARAAFYSYTADRIIADALRAFREHQLGDGTPDLMLRRATYIMSEVADVITADFLTVSWHLELLVPVVATNCKLRGIQKIVELVRRHYKVEVHKAILDRCQRLYKLYLDMSTRAEVVRNRGRPKSMPERPCAGRSTDNIGTRVV